MIKPITDLQFDKPSFNPKVQSKPIASIQDVIQGLEKTTLIYSSQHLLSAYSVLDIILNLSLY